MKSINTNCPKCGHQFNIQDTIYNRVKSELEITYLKEMDEFKTAYTKKEAELLSKEKQLQISIEKGVTEKLNSERMKITDSLRSQIEIEKSAEIESYKDQLKIKVQEAKELNRLKAEFERIQREKEELKDSIEAKMEIKLSELLKTEKEKFINDYDSKTTIRIAEKELVIKQLKDQLEMAQRKVNQVSVSQQISGEAQELCIEEFLKKTFQSDRIEEIKKGEKGADCRQMVINHLEEECGYIFYESKRAKTFKMDWITKFKEEILKAKAVYGVLVTEVYPPNVERMTNIHGIWVCSYNEFRGLSQVLRESILAVYAVAAFQENKDSKMEALYRFISSKEFRNHLEAIVEGFTQMESDINRERKSMEALWKQREKQISKVIFSTSQIYGAIKGISATALNSIKLLELPESKT